MMNVTRHPSFGTYSIPVLGKKYEFAQSRTEVYPKPGKMPKIAQFGVSIEADLKRRDFTVNAIAVNTSTDEVVAVPYAEEDISNRQLRVLHDQSFVDDPTRMLRMVKYICKLDFSVHPDTKALINPDLFDTVSEGRIQKEIDQWDECMVRTAYALGIVS